jgi:hypothetical protein
LPTPCVRPRCLTTRRELLTTRRERTNAELSRLGRARIIIPTLYHEQYVDAQRALSRSNDPEPIIRALSRIAEWRTLFDYSDVRKVVAEMKKTNAFAEDPREFRLLRPDGRVFA